MQLFDLVWQIPASSDFHGTDRSSWRGQWRFPASCGLTPVGTSTVQVFVQRGYHWCDVEDR